MIGKMILQALGEIGDEYITEAMEYGKGLAEKQRKPFSVLLIAAALVLILVGCSVVAVVYGDSIQSWFAYQWERMTGQTMSETQQGVIDHLSQEIGQSQTVGDLTVTVDSVTVGDDCFFLLLRVEGKRLVGRYSYGFADALLEVSPDPVDDAGGLGSYGFEYLGEDGDGAGLLMLTYTATSGAGYVEDTGALDVRLSLRDFVRVSGTRDKTVVSGEWQYAFSLDRSSLPETMELPDTEVRVNDLDTGSEVLVIMQDLVLTNTGVRFSYDFEDGTLAFSDQISAKLKNGQTVHVSGGGGTPLQGGPLLACSYQWQIPVDLNEIVAIQIGDTQIRLPGGENTDEAGG